MRSTAFAAAAGLAAIIPAAFAQTFSDCNPTNASQFPCPANAGLNTKTFDSPFSSGKNTSWSYVAPTVKYGSDGAEFTVSKRGEAPTIKTDFYIFYGKVEVTMKSAAGQGIISSIVLQSEDLDEIDYEFLGGRNSIVQSNYFGKGNTTTFDRMQEHNVATPQEEFHTYSVDWNKESIVWAIDDTTVRTLTYAEANGGDNFPQSPMNIRLGIWAGGDPDNNEGTISWAGGETTYDAAAGMPWTMLVKDVKITNYNPGCSYNYTDTSGSSESISITSDGCDLIGTPTGSAEAAASTAAGTAGSPNQQSETDASTSSPADGSNSGSASSGTDGSETALGSDVSACVPYTTIMTSIVTLRPGETAPVETTAVVSTVETPAVASTTADVEGEASATVPVVVSTTDELGSGTMTLAAPTGTDFPLPSDVPATSEVEGVFSTAEAVTTPSSTPTSPTPSQFTGAAAPTAMGGLRNALFLGGVAAVLAL